MNEHMGRHSLIDRLADQVGDRELALSILRKRGHVEEDSEELTAAGRKRDAMTAEERAKARAAKRSGHATTAYQYDPKTNAATLKHAKQKPYKKWTPSRPR